jgi:small neutral amino acid transporter SnatA (MarC family)
MAELIRACIVLLAVANPARAALGLEASPRQARALARDLAVAWAVIAVGLAALAAVSERLLDAWDVSPPSFRLGAGAIIALAGARSLVVAPRPWPELRPGVRAVVVPLIFPILLTPELVAAAVTLGADHGAWAVLAGLALAGIAQVLVLLYVARDPREVFALAIWRFAAALSVVVGLALVVDGIFAL